MATKKDKPLYLEHYEKILLELKPFVESIREIELNTEEMLFKTSITAAFTKCYDYNLYNSQSTEYDNSFYRLPMLRGICDDLITLSYLLNKPVEERNQNIKYLMFHYLYRTLKAQSSFFKEQNLSQITPNSDRFKKLAKPSTSSEDDPRLPKIERMAEEANLKSVYDFLYHATSAMVHFRPDTLMKLGWGDKDNKGNIKSRFSIENYSQHYHKFNTFYAWYLLKEQVYKFKDYLEIPEDIVRKIKKFNENFQNMNWPELTTSDHLNMNV